MVVVSYMRVRVKVEHSTESKVLYALKFLDVCQSCTVEERITLVKFGGDDGVNESFSGIRSK